MILDLNEEQPMQFKVIKASLDAISGIDSTYKSVDDVLREISRYRGWDSREQLHQSIRKWAKDARPGFIFGTQAAVIVCTGIDRSVHADDECTECGAQGMSYGDMESTEEGDISQEVWCASCGARWKDVFVLAERHTLSPKA